VAALNRALSDDAGIEAIRPIYAEYLVWAGGGAVQGGANDENYTEILRQGLDFYRRIRLQGMTVLKVHSTQIDAGTTEVAYMIQRRDGGPKVFAFVAGDEMGLYRKYGLVDEAARPEAVPRPLSGSASLPAPRASAGGGRRRLRTRRLWTCAGAV
jgi:hypothetical protein